MKILKYIKSLCSVDLQKEESYIKSYSFKRKFLDVNTLILGSSHGKYGYIPNENEFNLCLTSQDLYYSFKLLEKYQESLSNLKKVILFYSVFSKGFELKKTNEFKRCSFYKYFFGIPYSGFCLKSNIFLIKERISCFIRYCLRDLINDDLLYNGKEVLYDDLPIYSSLKERVEAHIKNNRRESDQNIYIESIFNLLNKKEQELIIVIPPCRSDYTNLCNKYDNIYMDIILFSNCNNIKLLNFWNDIDFNDECFADTDHLNVKGTEILTDKIRKKL